MKILDRYILTQFLKNYLIALLVLLGMYIMLDMIFNFDELAQFRATEGTGAATGAISIVLVLVEYYFYQSFLIFVHLSGIIPVAGVAFTLFRLTRNNELTAMIAAGTPLLRIASPIILASVVLSFALVVVQELVIPRMIPQLIRTHDQLAKQTVRTYPIRGMQDPRSGAVFFASRYTPPTGGESARMQVLDIIERDQNRDPSAHVRAEEARWDETTRSWLLTNGVRVTGLTAEARRSLETPIDRYESALDPTEVAMWRSGDFVELLSTENINALIAREKSVGIVDLMRVKHTRFAQYVLNIVLLLMAIPFLLNRDPTALRVRVLVLLGVSAACLGTIFLCHHLAGRPPDGDQWLNLWPALLAWAPIVIFTPVAIFLLDRLHTRWS
jgi:lipopolysaccharide export LptBFGC system permease protein LptF